MRYLGLVTAVVLVVACRRPSPSAVAVCEKLVAAGVASNCEEEGFSEGLDAAASSRARFDLPTVPGKSGQVLTFARSVDYAATAKAFNRATVRHYGSERALVFVQLSSEAPADVAAATAAVVKALPSSEHRGR